MKITFSFRGQWSAIMDSKNFFLTSYTKFPETNRTTSPVLSHNALLHFPKVRKYKCTMTVKLGQHLRKGLSIFFISMATTHMTRCL